jgi:orotate phosphoribosyltransferase
MEIRIDCRYLMEAEIGAGKGLSSEEIGLLKNQAGDAHESLMSRLRIGLEGSPLDGLALHDLRKQVAAVGSMAERMAVGTTDLLILGAGGGISEARALLAALASPTGQGPSGIRGHVMDPMSPGVLESRLCGLDPQHTVVLVTTRTGDDDDTLALFLVVWDWMIRAIGREAAGCRFVVSSDSGSGMLPSLARKEGLALIGGGLEGPGRVLAPGAAGFFLAGMLGLDVDALWRGSRSVFETVRAAGGDMDRNPSLLLAATVWQLATVNGRRSHIFLPFHGGLRGWSEWLRWAGGAVFSCSGAAAMATWDALPRDVDAFLEACRAQPEDWFVTLLRVCESGSSGMIPARFADYPETGRLAGRSWDRIAEEKAALAGRCLARAGVPNVSVSISRICEKSIGALMQAYAMAAAYAGELEGLHAPGEEPESRECMESVDKEEQSPWILVTELSEDPALAVSAGVERELEQGLRETEAMLEGHFLLRSGKHSSVYFQMALLLQHPEWAARCGRWLAELWAGAGIDCVVGPAMGGVIIAHEVARALRCKCLFAEKDAEGRLTLRRNFRLDPDARVLVAEDVVTKGTAVAETVSVLRQHGVEPVGVGVLLDRSGGNRMDIGVEIRSLMQRSAPIFEPDDCPLCRKGMDLIKPGSGKVS